MKESRELSLLRSPWCEPCAESCQTRFWANRDLYKQGFAKWGLHKTLRPWGGINELLGIS